MQDLFDLVVCGTLRNGYLDSRRLKGKEIHDLIVRIAFEQVVCTCNVGTVKTVKLTDDREEELIGDKPLIV